MADTGNGSPASVAGLTSDQFRRYVGVTRDAYLRNYPQLQGYSIFQDPASIYHTVTNNNINSSIASIQALSDENNLRNIVFPQAKGLQQQIDEVKQNQLDQINSRFDRIEKEGQQDFLSKLGDWGQSAASAIGNAYQLKNLYKYATVRPKTPNPSFKSTANTQLIGRGMDLAATLLTGFGGDKTEYAGDFGQYTKAIDTATNAAADVLLATGTPWGAIAGLAIKGTNLLGQGLNKLGAGTDGMTRSDAILGAGVMSPMFWWNGAFGARTRDFIQDTDTMEQIGSSYGGLQYNINEALSKANKKYGVLSKNAMNRANEQIGRTIEMQNTAATIAENTSLRKDLVNSMSEFNSLKRQRELEPQFNSSVMSSKQGGTLKPVYPTLTLRPVYPQEIDDKSQVSQTFKQGGSVNIIPNGALHARLHHLDIDNITTKGIPVVSKNEDGTIEQQAEIENNEIILRLEVTKKLEEMANTYYASETSERKKNYMAIEAGKLLTQEILYNTQDNTGLLNNATI